MPCNICAPGDEELRPSGRPVPEVRRPRRDMYCRCSFHVCGADKLKSSPSFSLGEGRFWKELDLWLIHVRAAYCRGQRADRSMRSVLVRGSSAEWFRLGRIAFLLSSRSVRTYRTWIGDRWHAGISGRDKGMKFMARIWVSILAGLLLFLSAPLAIAAEEWRSNTHLLPPYCKDRSDPWGPGWAKWRDYFGTVHVHMSHYCAGIYAELKAKRAVTKRERDAWLGGVVSQMAYVSPHCDQKCVIYAELHRRWAWALAQQGQFAEAVKHTRLAAAAEASTPSTAPPPSPR